MDITKISIDKVPKHSWNNVLQQSITITTIEELDFLLESLTRFLLFLYTNIW